MEISPIASELAVCDQIVDGNILVIVLLDLGRTKRYSYHYKRQYLDKIELSIPNQKSTGAVANDLQSIIQSV